VSNPLESNNTAMTGSMGKQESRFQLEGLAQGLGLEVLPSGGRPPSLDAGVHCLNISFLYIWMIDDRSALFGSGDVGLGKQQLANSPT
jgi:hypothetical protein